MTDMFSFKALNANLLIILSVFVLQFSLLLSVAIIPF